MANQVAIIKKRCCTAVNLTHLEALFSLLKKIFFFKRHYCIGSWRNYATSKEKGMEDGLGGSAKNLVRRKVINRVCKVV